MAIVTEVIAAVVPAVLLAFGGILCAACSEDLKSCIRNLYTDFKSSLKDFFKPKADEDLNDLRSMETRIISISPSEERDRWISAANTITARYNNLPPSDQIGGLLSCCLVGEKCFRCGIRRKVKELVMEGNQIITLQPLKVEFLFVVPELLEPAAKKTLERVTSMLGDDQVLRIGIWGDQACDNSTVVKVLNNKLYANPDPFRLVIFIQLTENVNEIYLQKVISRRLKLQVKDTDVIAGQIRNRLLKEKCLLILDSVSKSIDLGEIGIPESRGMSKIVLTSRSKDVCDLMEAKKIRMKSLTSAGSFLPIDEEYPNALKIVKLMADVSQECEHLPSVLVDLEQYELDMVYVSIYPGKSHGRFSKKINCYVDNFDETK